jgi:hypothetical protein
VTTDRQPFEALLRSAAADVAWPATPDLRDGVLALIAATPAASSAPSAAASAPSVHRRRFRAARALALALVALLVLAGVAAALGYRLPGLDILFVDDVPPAGTGLDLGAPVSLGEARDGEPPRVLVPAALAEPSKAFVLGTGADRIVTLVWRAAPGERSIPGSDLSLALTAVAGRTDEGFLTKLLGPGTTIEPVSVGSGRGWWIAGAPHDLLVQRPDGTVDVVSTRLAGDTLVFARERTLYRLESALGRDATVVIAASMR